MKKKIALWFAIIGLGCLMGGALVGGSTVGAAVDDCPDTMFFSGPDGVCEPGESADGAITELVIRVLNWALIGVGTVVVIFVVIGGMMYMTAAGSQERAKQGMTIIRNAVLGLVLYLVMITVLNFIIPGGVFIGT